MAENEDPPPPKTTTGRTYHRFRYSDDDLQAALQAVRSGILSANKASKQYGIPKGTLINKLHGKVPEHRRMGPIPILSKDEENRLEEWILGKAKIGFPMHPNEVKDAVQKVMIQTERKNPFTDNRPGDKWLKLFLQRKPEISKRNAEIISKARASVTEGQIRDWFHELEEYALEEGCPDILLDGDRIYNADETGVQLCPKTGKVLGPRHYRNFYDVAVGHEKECITVLANFSGSGKAVPPMVVLPYQRIPRDIADSIPDEYFIGRSESGWMVAQTFYEYVANCFYPWLLKNKVVFPILFLLDGHKSHINSELRCFCIEKRILLFCLLPNATHILQACDVGVFRPLKVHWRNEVRHFKQTSGKSVTRTTFAPIFKKAFDRGVKEETVKNAFAACGLFPFNVENVDYSKCMANRHKEVTGENLQQLKEKEEANTFLRVLEQEISPHLLMKFRDSGQNEEIVEDRTLFEIWKKFTAIVNGVKNDQVPVNEHRHIHVRPLMLQGLPAIPQDHDYLLQENPDRDNLESLEFTELGNLTVDICTTSENDDQSEPALMKESEVGLSNGKGSVHQQEFFDETVPILPTTQEPSPRTKTPESVWDEHLHWPRKEPTKKRVARHKSPFAVTSKKWKTYHDLKTQEKDRIEENKRKRKEDRDAKKKAPKKPSEKGTKKPKKTIQKKKPDFSETETDSDNMILASDGESGTEELFSLLKHRVLFNDSDYVIVEYEQEYFPGIVIQKTLLESEVRVMAMSGPNMWKWPEKADQIWYKNSDIKEKIASPVLVTARGQYTVPEITKYRQKTNL